MKFARILFALALAFSAATSARGEDGVVSAVGMAKTYNAAVSDALASAVKQRNGATFSISEAFVASETGSSETVTENGQGSDRFSVVQDDKFGKDVQIKADGSIEGYEVKSTRFNEGSGLYEVTVDVRFKPKPGEYRLDGADDPGARRRMVVATFRPHGSTVSIRGENISTAEWAMAFADKLNDNLSQTRKFTMLDRKFSAEVNDELARIAGANADPRDYNRLNKQLGTDYLVVGEVRFADVQPPRIHPVTLQVLPEAPQLFAEVSYRVLLAPTGQLKWSGSVKLDTAMVGQSDTGAFIVASTEIAANKIADEIMSNILPFEIVDVDNGIVVIGQGGNTLAVGERFTVYAIGKTVYDSRLGEAIGETEIPVGTVEVIGVQAKLSYAKIVGDFARAPEAGMILRRVKVVPVAPQPAALPAPRPHTIFAPTGGVVTPF